MVKPTASTTRAAYTRAADMKPLEPATITMLCDSDRQTGCKYNRTVAISVKLFDISGINDVSQTFNAKFQVDFAWARQESFRPRVMIINSEDTQFELEDDRNLPAISNDPDIQQQMTKVSLQLSCSLDFRWFPFDVQYLPLHFRASTKDGGQLGSFPLKPSRFMFGVVSRELVAWRVIPSHIAYDETSTASSAIYCDLSFFVKASRVSSTYAVNVIAIPSLFTICTFSASAIPPDDPASRLSVALTLLLTLTAFKLMVNEMVPKAPYLTAADWHLLACFSTIFAALTEHWCVAFFHAADPAVEQWVDRMLLGTIFAAFVGWNMVFTLSVVRHRRRAEKGLLRDRSLRAGTEAVYIGAIETNHVKAFAERMPLDA